MVNVGQYMWIYTADHELNVVHISTMQNIACILLETNLSVIEMLHVPEWQVVIVLWRKSQLWFIHDKIRDGLHVMDVIKHDPVIHMCVVNLSERTEVWATQGDRNIVIFESSSNGFQSSDSLHCTVENKSLFTNLIVCLCFTSTISGNNMLHVWVSFHQLPHLVCWNAKQRIQINCIKTNTGTYICNSYTMGTSAFPDIYTQARGPQARVQLRIYRQSTSACGITIMFYFRIEFCQTNCDCGIQF